MGVTQEVQEEALTKLLASCLVYTCYRGNEYVPCGMIALSLK